MNFFERLKNGLGKTRAYITGSLEQTSAEIGPAFFEALEETLIRADVGIDLSDATLEALKELVEQEGVTSREDAYDAMKKIIAAGLTINKTPDDFPPKPWVILVVGVNGVGKTTTIGKLAGEYAAKGKSVILGAADTFRAGAIEQLKIWAERTGSGFVAQNSGGDPASVAFDAMEAARSRGTDVLILDTAGRLHNKTNLMNELDKIVRVIRRSSSTAPNETLLVIDATTGQNAFEQAKVFNSITSVTGLVITKLDGTAKGGIALSLTKKLGIPIKKIGVGEGMTDLQDFDPHAYVDAMFGTLRKTA